MSVTPDDESEEVGGDSWLIMTVDDGPRNGRRPQRVGWRIGAAVCLVLLLAVTFVVHYSIGTSCWDKYRSSICNQTTDRDTLRGQDALIKEDQLKTYTRNLSIERDSLRDERDHLKVLSYNLTADRDTLKSNRDALRDELDQLKAHSTNLTRERNTFRGQREALQNEKDALRDECDALKDERDQLKSQSSNLTQERNTLKDERDALKNERDQLKTDSSHLMRRMEALQSQYNSVVASRDALQQEVDQMRLRPTAKTCLQGWSLFKNKCYFFSPSGHGKSWGGSRQDCQGRGGDLAMPKTQAESNFVSRRNVFTWIGLSDRLQEGRWMWVDGTELEGYGFWKSGEPNDAFNNEDCVEVARDEMKWNDASCDTEFAWVCEA